MKKILLAVDGSKESTRAAAKAAEIAEATKAKVSIITVLETGDIKLREVEAYIPEKTIEELRESNKEELKEKGNKFINEATQYFEDRNIKPKKVIKVGDPADEICNYAEQEDFDMIVLADKGMGGVKRFFLGSISSKVVRHANKSVLVVK